MWFRLLRLSQSYSVLLWFEEFSLTWRRMFDTDVNDFESELNSHLNCASGRTLTHYLARGHSKYLAKNHWIIFKVHSRDQAQAMGNWNCCEESQKVKPKKQCKRISHDAPPARHLRDENRTTHHNNCVIITSFYFSSVKSRTHGGAANAHQTQILMLLELIKTLTLILGAILSRSRS